MTENAVRNRAANAFWNAAGDYALEPPMLFATESDPCLYENLATGLMCKHFGTSEVAALFAIWKDDHRAARLDEIAWLVLERAGFLREQADRPALSELRASFLAGLSPEEREVSRHIEALPAQQITTLAQARGEIARLQKSLCGFDGRIVRTPAPSLHLGVSLLALASREGGRSSHGRLFIHRALGSAQDRKAGSRKARKSGTCAAHREQRAERSEAEDRTYIESCFGPLACSPDVLRRLEERVCTGAHEGSRLWIAAAAHEHEHAPAPTPARNSHDLRELALQAEEQHRRNLAFYGAHRNRFDSIAEAIARHLRDALATASHLREPRHKSGQLDVGRAWRIGVLDDPRAFSRRVERTAADISLDLLLDASGSRSAQQAEIAAQAYIIGRAFQLCGAPVRISSYATLRNHTVLRFFNDYRSSAGSASPNALRNVFRYYAAGFNRDGLALRALGDIIEHGLPPLKASPAKKRLLIVLTDAAPMDEERSYVGKPAIADTAAQVHTLQDAGLQVAALYTGSDDFFHDAKAIYGSSLARVRNVERLAAAAQALVDALLR